MFLFVDILAKKIKVFLLTDNFSLYNLCDHIIMYNYFVLKFFIQRHMLRFCFTYFFL